MLLGSIVLALLDSVHPFVLAMLIALGSAAVVLGVWMWFRARSASKRLNKVKRERTQLQRDNEKLRDHIEKLRGHMQELTQSSQRSSAATAVDSALEVELLEEQIAIYQAYLNNGDVNLTAEDAIGLVLDSILATVFYSPNPRDYRLIVAKPLDEGTFRMLAVRRVLLSRIADLETKFSHKGDGKSIAGRCVVTGEDILIPDLANKEDENLKYYVSYPDKYGGFERGCILGMSINHPAPREGARPHERCLAVLTATARFPNMITSQHIRELKPYVVRIRQILLSEHFDRLVES